MLQTAPVSSSQRLETLDVLRGFALLGILAMNIRIMAGTFGSYMYPLAMFEYTGAHRAAYLFTTTFVDLKMMGLFSMLFGVSVLLYAAKSGAPDRALRGLWFRRMFWLLVIGFVHAYLIWDGDILVTYALCGMLLLWWVRRLSAPALFAASCVMLLVGAGLAVGHWIGWGSMSDEQRSEELAMMMPTEAQTGEQLAAMLGSYVDVVAYRAPSLLLFQTMYFLLFFLWRCGGMMLLGMALYKCGFLDGRRDARTYAVTAAICLPVGLGLAWNGAMTLDAIRFAMPDRLLLDLWNYIGAVLASVGYASMIILAIKIDALGWLRHRLAAVGQMALTNYLFHSVLTSIVFLGWGLGFAGRLDYAGQLYFVVAVWIFQLIISPIWLARYRFGPAEWLWRSLTYWKRQPMRRDTTSSGIGDVPAPA
jgi:uncharacterized protein